MKKNPFKWQYLLAGVCVFAAAGTALSFTVRHLTQSRLKEIALQPPAVYVEPEHTPVPKEVPAAKPETQIKKEPEDPPREETAPQETAASQSKAFSPVMPVEGTILNNHSGAELVYSKTFEDYRVHNGIDIAAERSAPVKAVFDGVVEEVFVDPLEGITIVINHNNSYRSVYKNLSTEKMVKKGETVTQGQAISGVGETAVFEASEESHLHFELLKDDKQVDPAEYLK